MTWSYIFALQNITITTLLGHNIMWYLLNRRFSVHTNDWCVQEQAGLARDIISIAAVLSWVTILFLRIILHYIVIKPFGNCGTVSLCNTIKFMYYNLSIPHRVCSNLDRQTP